MTFSEIINQAGLVYGIILIAFLLTYIAFYGKGKEEPRSPKRRND